MFGLKYKKRQHIRSRPFLKEWEEILEKNVPYYHRLTPDDQAELRGHIQVFLEEKQFEGCDGQEINDEVRVTIAAQACMLLLHRETAYYPTLRSILVYPHPFFSPKTQRLPGGVVAEGVQGRLGESWIRGPDFCFLSLRVFSQDFAVHLEGQHLNALTQLLRNFGQLGVLLKQLHEFFRVLLSKCQTLITRHGKGFPMLRIGLGVSFVPVRLSRLRKQNKWRCIGRLETEGQIEQNERVDVELGEAESVYANPDGNDRRLCHQKNRRSKKTGEGFGF